MKLLLHICCAPCSVACIKQLRSEGIEPVSLWFNPNIHPWTEYDARRSTLVNYGEMVNLDVRVLEDYGLRKFVRAVASDIDHRCRYCYTIRLGTAAKYAAENGFKNTRLFIDDGFSGTNFDRPAFNEIMKLGEEGKIGTLIVKDHSRLGRNRLVPIQLN